MVQILEWFLSKKHLKGFALGHPVLGNSPITTSNIEDIKPQEDYLIITTKSGSEYRADYNRADLAYWDCTLDSLIFYEVANEVESKIKSAKPYLLPVDLKEDELYLEVADNQVICGYTQSSNGPQKVELSRHYGTFQDSILITDRHKISFNYFPTLCGMSYYMWDGFKTLIINNLSNNPSTLVKSSTDNSITLPPGITRCTEEDFKNK